MNYTRISDIEPSSVILSHANYSKISKYDAKIMQKQIEAKKKNYIIDPHHYNFIHGKILCPRNATKQPMSTVELGYKSTRGPMFHQQGHSPRS